MLYNRVKEHVVNDKKKMYKRGSQWVVVSAFAIALGGVAFTQVQPVSAATTESRLTVQPVTLTQQGQSTGASTQHESASSIQSEQTTAQTTAAPSQAAVSQAAAPQQSVATYQDANSSVASTPTPSGMTEAEWQAQKAKYDQAKSSAAQSEAAATQKAGQAIASYASSLTAQSSAQAQNDRASLAAASSSAASSLAALKQHQDSSYAAASSSAQSQIDSLNSQRTSSQATSQVSDGGTFSYVAEHGLWTNVVTHNDASKTWNGNYLVQNLPVFKNPNDAGMMDDIYVHSDDGEKGSQNQVPSWSLGDVIKNNQLTDAQKSELNQYAMMLVNNYRKSMGLSSLITTQDFLEMVQKRGNSLKNGHMVHNPDLTTQIFGREVNETLTSVSFESFMGNRYNDDPTMLEVMEGVSSAINGLLNYDSDNGHRNLLLGNYVDTGFSLQYNTNDNVWVMNSNGSYSQYDGNNILSVPTQTSGPTPTKDNNKEIDQKIQQVKNNLQDLKNTQDQQYQEAKSSSDSAIKQLADKFSASEAQTTKENQNKLTSFKADQDKVLATFIAELNKKVEAMNPGPKPSTPSSGASSGASSSSASSSGSSASSSASSSSASSLGSSASSSASSSSASSSGSSASSSASSSSASSTGSSASSSASSSSASSTGSSASSSASSSSASSTGSSAFSSASSSSASSAGSSASSSASSSSSSAGSSASSSTSSSSASSAGTTASSSTSSSSTSSAAVAPLRTTQSTNPQPMSRMAQKNGKHAYPATGEGQTGLLLAEAGAAIIAVLGFAGVRKARHAK